MTDETDDNDFADLGSSTPPPSRPTFDARAIETRAEVDRLIRALNTPGDHRKVFQFAGRAVVIVRDKSSVLRTGSGKKPIIRSVPRQATKGLLAGPIERVSSWEVFDGRTQDMQPRQVPPWVFSTIIEIFGEGLPALAGVADFPVMVGKNKLLCGRTGYDVPTGLYVDCEPVDLETSKFTDPRQAFQWLMDNWLSEFPFETPQDAARALAIPITILNRRTRIHSGAPVPFITAPQVETGKTLLAQVLVEVITNATLPVSAWDHDNEQERRKTLLSLAIENPAAVLFDNINNGWEIRDATLDKYITSDEFKDRLLGKNETATAPATCLPIFTGNNISAGSADLASRSYQIRMEAPPGRRKYGKSDLRTWTQDNRTKIIQALMCIASVDKRKLPAYVPSSRFPSWAECVGGPIQYAADDKTLFRAWTMASSSHGNEDLEALCDNMASRRTINEVGYTSTQMADMFSDQIIELLGTKGNEFTGKIPFKRIYGLLKRYEGHPAGDNRFKIVSVQHPTKNDRNMWVFKAIPMA